jgi:hypothetical protein
VGIRHRALPRGYAAEIVQRIEQLPEQLGLRASAGFVPLAQCALAIVVEFCGEPKIAILVFVDLTLGITGGTGRALLLQLRLRGLSHVVVRHVAGWNRQILAVTSARVLWHDGLPYSG